MTKETQLTISPSGPRQADTPIQLTENALTEDALKQASYDTIELTKSILSDRGNNNYKKMSEATASLEKGVTDFTAEINEVIENGQPPTNNTLQQTKTEWCYNGIGGRDNVTKKHNHKKNATRSSLDRFQPKLQNNASSSVQKLKLFAAISCIALTVLGCMYLAPVIVTALPMLSMLPLHAITLTAIIGVGTLMTRSLILSYNKAKDREGKELETLLEDQFPEGNLPKPKLEDLIERLDSHDAQFKGDATPMMRAINDTTEDDHSIIYTGRADNMKRALEQIKWIMEKESAKESDSRKGFATDHNNNTTFTLSVTNLMDSGNLKVLMGGFNEQASILNEQACFHFLNNKTIEFNNKNVTLKILFANQDISMMTTGLFGQRPAIQSKINATFIKDLEEIYQTGYVNGLTLPQHDQDLYTKATNALKKPSALYPEAEFFYRDLIMKILKLPAVTHCKSSIDRTSVATSISAATEHFYNQYQQNRNSRY